jgi:hypothetical protein
LPDFLRTVGNSRATVGNSRVMNRQFSRDEPAKFADYQ